jgi:hypothetical protein
MRAAASIASSLVMALAAIGLAVAAPGRDRAAALASLTDVTGRVSIANSRETESILSAAGMRPGESVSGTVTVGNDGDVAGRFTLAAGDVEDVPGPNGGVLSERVVLEVDDVTDPGSPRVVFAGHPAEFGEYDIGTLAPGDERSFVFAARLPDGGLPPSSVAGDNLFQQASLSIGFEWAAGVVTSVTPTTTPTPTPTPTPKPKPTPTPTPAPVAPVSVADMIGMPPANTCISAGKLSFKVKAPPGTRLRAAVVGVNGKIKLRLKGAKLAKPVVLRRLRKTTKLTLSVRLTNGKAYRATRTYKVCHKR